MVIDKAAMFLVLFVFLSFVAENESYVTVIDSDTYRTVTNFADNCVKWKDLRGPLRNKRWKKLKKKFKRFKFEDEVCFQVKEKYCSN
ncbi:hypothetical protein ACROYT_G019029 [Oculina patagonica]